MGSSSPLFSLQSWDKLATKILNFYKFGKMLKGID